MALPRFFAGGAVRTTVTMYVFAGAGQKKLVKGLQIMAGGVPHRIYDQFAPVSTPYNISQFLDPDPVGGKKRSLLTFANPPNDSLNHQDIGLADTWAYRLMGINFPGTYYYTGTWTYQSFGVTAGSSPYVITTGCVYWFEVALRRSSNNMLGPVAETSHDTAP